MHSVSTEWPVGWAVAAAAVAAAVAGIGAVAIGNAIGGAICVATRNAVDVDVSVSSGAGVDGLTLTLAVRTVSTVVNGIILILVVIDVVIADNLLLQLGGRTNTRVSGRHDEYQMLDKANRQIN